MARPESWGSWIQVLRPVDTQARMDTRTQAGTTSRESKVSWTQGIRLEDSQAWMDTQIQEDRTIRVNLESWAPGLPPADTQAWVDTLIQEDRTIRVNLEKWSPARGDTQIQVGTMSRGLKEDSWSLVLRSADNRAWVDTLTLADTRRRGARDRKNPASRLADTLDRDSRLVPADRMSRENLESWTPGLPPADTQAWVDTRTLVDTMSRE